MISLLEKMWITDTSWCPRQKIGRSRPFFKTTHIKKKLAKTTFIFFVGIKLGVGSNIALSNSALKVEVDKLIIRACQPVLGYFMFRWEEITNSVRLLLRVFGLLSSSLLLFLQRFGWYVLRPSSGVCQTREPSRNFEVCPLLNWCILIIVNWADDFGS